MIKKLIFLAVGILLFNYCFSQENDTIKYKRLVKFPVFTIDNYNNPNTGFTANNKNASIGTNEFITQLCFAVPIKKQKTFLFNNIKYYDNTYQMSLNSTESFSANVHTFRYIFGFIQVLPERWRLTINLVPNICTDFKEPIGAEDFIFYGAVLAMKRADPNREFGFGLAYASYISLFEGPMLIPLYTLVKNGKLTTRIIFPTYFTSLTKIRKLDTESVLMEISITSYPIKSWRNLILMLYRILN